MIRFVTFFCLLITSLSTIAGKLDILMMPGQVISGHASIEQQCEQCHETLNKENQSYQCLACHDHADIAKDIEDNMGFHGRLEKELVVDCRHCHTDHIGRSADIVKFDSESFNHEQTDYILNGAHKLVDCVLCHKNQYKKYSQAPDSCIGCHEIDDTHGGKLGEQCEKCHNEESWEKQKFNHDEDTKYKLVGQHVEIACKLCHAGEFYKNTPKKCINCHLINDIHNGHYADKCEKCHTSHDWKKLNFDHNKDTEYPLNGRHKTTQCSLCHTKGPYEQKPENICIKCHSNDDEHKGRNGKDCKQCHTPRMWNSVEFNHDKDTSFSLKGRHAELVCTACHRSSSMEMIKQANCNNCHSAVDVHKGEQGENCENCHAENSWSQDVKFDHDLTRFPLIGMHGITSCEACHLSTKYREADRNCFECHNSEDTHQGRFGENCSGCHNPNGWMLWTFNHKTQANYPLEGAHEELYCHSCHLTSLTKNKNPSSHCYGCHRRDDIHRGSFGQRCKRCHSLETFKNAVIK